MIAHTLRTIADLVDLGHPVRYVGVADNGSVTVVVSNEVTAIKWHARFEERGIGDGVAIVLAPIGVP